MRVAECRLSSQLPLKLIDIDLDLDLWDTIETLSNLLSGSVLLFFFILSRLLMWHFIQFRIKYEFLNMKKKRCKVHSCILMKCR